MMLTFNHTGSGRGIINNLIKKLQHTTNTYFHTAKRTSLNYLIDILIFAEYTHPIYLTLCDDIKHTTPDSFNTDDDFPEIHFQ